MIFFPLLLTLETKVFYSSQQSGGACFAKVYEKDVRQTADAFLFSLCKEVSDLHAS